MIIVVAVMVALNIIVLVYAIPVSYTHLDVYKRQPLHRGKTQTA